MRVLFTTQPALGHFHPLVPLARALAAAGHEVAVACARSFCPTVEASGLRALPAGLDWLEEDDWERIFPGLTGIPHGPGRLDWIMANVFAGVTAERMAADLLTLAVCVQPGEKRGGGGSCAHAAVTAARRKASTSRPC